MDSNISKPREVRVFLSSTFKDMEAERSHLVKHVFPRIRAACLTRQVGFTEIDLRWGITEEESKNGATVEICLKEINRCRDFPPFFIGFLGERYGWIPSDGELSAYWTRHEDSPYATSIRNAIKRGISVTELEMELAVLGEGAAEKLRGHALFLLRDRTLTDSLYQNETGKAPDLDDSRYYDPGGDKLAKLKERLRASPFLGLDGYTSIEQFGQAIEQHLVDQINRHFPADNIPDSHQLGNVAHSAFRNQRLQNFLPRDDVRQALVSAIEDRRTSPDLATILIAGPSGQGKSAIMADLARHLESLPGYRVIDHYIGADGDTSLDGWVHRILRTLHPVIADQVRSIPKSAEDRTNALPEWLSMAASRQQCRYVLILDALDQLDDQGKDIRMLRHSHIGPAATVIASAADDTTVVKSAVGLGFEIHVVPPFDHLQRERMITETLARYRKEMRPELVRKIAAAPPTGSPLFLMLALEKLRLDARHESLAADVDDILAQPDPEKLFLTKFLRDEDYGQPGQPTLALEFMALLAASRNGLTEHELSELLAMPNDPKSEETGRPRLPQIYLSQLIAVFQPFLINKQGNRAPMHSLLGQVALSNYGVENARNKIADYFEQEWRSDRNLDRVAIELVGQLYVLRDDEKLKGSITDPRIALRICKRNPYEFSHYWVKVVRNCGESDHQSKTLVRRLIENQESSQSDLATRTGESLFLAQSLLHADEVEWASRLYHGIVMQFKMTGGRVPENYLKDALRGFVQCFLKRVVSIARSTIDENTSEQLLEMGDKAMDFMAHLLSITKNDSCIERAEDALLLSELREKSCYLTGTTREDEELRAKDIADALIILEDDKCKLSSLFHTTKVKAYTMMLKAQLDAISRSWNTPKVRNKMINQALEISESFQEYAEDHLLSGHPQRVFLYEQLHTLYSQAAYATSDTQDPNEFWLDAAAFAWKTINEIEQSYFSGDQHDMRLLNAAETISLALEAGCPVHKSIMNILLNTTNPERLAETASQQIREFSEEVHTRLLSFCKP